MNDANAWQPWDGSKTVPISRGDRVMIRRTCSPEVEAGPYRVELVDWQGVREFRRVAESPEVERLKGELGAMTHQHELQRTEIDRWSALCTQTADALAALLLSLGTTVVLDSTAALLLSLGTTVVLDSTVAQSVMADMVKLISEHIAAQDGAYDAVLKERDALVLDLATQRVGGDSALRLQRVFLADAEVREARAQRDHVSVKLEYKLLIASIASAVSRGHLPGDFFQQLKEWTK